MNKDQTINLIQTLFTLGGGVLATKGIGDSHLWETIGGAVVALATWLLTHKWNSTPTTMLPASIPIKTVLSVLALSCVLGGLLGCAVIQPGNDPLVVNVERTETMAKGTFDMVLGIDNDKRDFYAAKVPAFHKFCEWLRQPQSVPDFTSTNGAFATLPRCSAMLLSLDNVKLEYKSARASSNEVITALQTVTSAIAQANAWINTGVATNSTP